MSNGEIIQMLFPDVEIKEITGSFDKDKLLGYRTWLGGHSQDYSLDWWDAPYKAESIPYLMHKETGCPLIECKKAYDLAMEYLRSKARLKG